MNRVSFTVFVLLAGLISAAWALSSGGPFAEAQGQPRTRTSRQWVDDQWRLAKAIYEEVVGYAERPDDGALSSLEVEWQEPELDRLGNHCTVRGRLTIAGESGERRPVDWLQGISLYVARSPDARRDWSDGMDERDTLKDTAIVGHDGSFEMSVDTRDMQRERDLPQRFQMGLALAMHSAKGANGQEIVWRSDDAVVPATVQMIEIPMSWDLSFELALLNRAGDWPHGTKNSVHLIRAVNALQRLGKDRALATLEQYQQFAGMENQSSVYWIIRLLFEPITLDERQEGPTSVGLTHSVDWPLAPMAMAGDVPFMPMHGVMFSSSLPNGEEQIIWARRHGVIRDEPLCPSMNPLEAADTILRSAQFAQVGEYSHDDGTRQAREQAMAMVADLLPPIDAGPYDDAEQDRQWRERVSQSIELGITWDAEREEFVIPAEE